MKADFRVCLDACVLANFGVCDLFLRLSERPRLIVPVWSEQILAEVRRTHLRKLNWPESLADSFQENVRRAFPQACIEINKTLLPALQNDEKDRHVLATAICGNCSLIVTFNLKDFHKDALAPWGVEACHPQKYLDVLYDIEPKRIMSCLGQIAGHRGLDLEDVLIRLGQTLPAFSTRLLDELSG